ncbi:MAG: hypothetical protein M5R36_29605 [Deltaproteobacteria bacterium]|nr:hypothetical protein [Deltaproteobacteria bacterium]
MTTRRRATRSTPAPAVFFAGDPARYGPDGAPVEGAETFTETTCCTGWAWQQADDASCETFYFACTAVEDLVQCESCVAEFFEEFSNPECP